MYNDGKYFALKEVPIIKDIDDRYLFHDQIDSLRTEIKTLSRLQHKNIIRYLGTSLDGSHLCIHLEFIEGGSLHALLASFGAFPIDVIREYAKQMLCGLAFIHSNGLIHRDIKPKNILVSKEGIIKIADFGCVKKLEQLNSTVSLAGTLSYMSPEAHRQRDVSEKTDIWSFACTVIAMANGNGPSWHDSAHYQVYRIITDESKVFNEIPRCLGVNGMQMVKSCLRRFPDNRPDAKTLLGYEFLRERSEMKQECESTLCAIKKWAIKRTDFVTKKQKMLRVRDLGGTI